MEKIGIFFSVLLISVTLFFAILTGSPPSQNISSIPVDQTYSTTSVPITKTLTPQPYPTPSPNPSPTPVVKTVLFSDDLSKRRIEWDEEYDGSFGKTFYSAGSLHMRKTIHHELHMNFNDFILHVDVKNFASLNNLMGVFIRYQNSNNYYSLTFSEDGYYYIKKRENGKTQDLIVPTRSSYINAGNGQINHIRVEANKNTLNLSVNGHHLSTVTDNSFNEGTVALMADCVSPNFFSEVVYNNLVITTI